jgi:formylglycine-generating enzyme
MRLKRIVNKKKEEIMRKYLSTAVIILMLAMSAGYGKDGGNVNNEMVFVKGGTFQMSGNSTKVADFYLSKYEVTQHEWGKHMPAFYYQDQGAGLNYPVYFVSWYEVLAYSNKRSIAEGLNPCYSINGSTDPDVWGIVPTTPNELWDNVECSWKANGYRMPTEAEWEYAAGGGIKSKGYLFSGSADYLKVAWMEENSGNRLHQVGLKQPNELGFYDMSGNLYEWCWDWYSEDPTSAQQNSAGPAEGKFRVEKGGGWDRGVNACKIAGRYYFKPCVSYGGIGVRIARTK